MGTLQCDPKANVIVIEVKVWGSLVTTARMVLDTGASLVMLPWKIATALELEINPKNTIRTTTASTVESAPLVTIPKMSALGEEVQGVEALIKDLPPESGVDGLLGLSFLRHFKLTIDFKNGNLSLKKNL